MIAMDATHATCPYILNNELMSRIMCVHVRRGSMISWDVIAIEDFMYIDSTSMHANVM